MNQTLFHFFWIASLSLVVISVALLYLAIRINRDAQRARRLVYDAQEELDHALTKINSSDLEGILAGLQVIAMLRDREMQMAALPRVSVLACHENAQIAAQAKATMEKMAKSWMLNRTKNVSGLGEVN